MQEKAQFLLGDGRRTVERLEVLQGPTGRRSWPEAVKARIVAELFAAGARVADVARRHDVAPQQVTTWRRAARRGKLALPSDETVEFAALLLDEPSAGAKPGCIEIEVNGMVVRLPGESPAARVAEIATALRAAS